jgi:hypothetical protein
MEGQYAPQSAFGQQPFFYYQPEADNRQHFTPQPHTLPYPQQHMQQPQQMVMYAPNNYERPHSTSPQAHYVQMNQYQQPLMTPVHSPQPMYQKPQIVLHQQESPYLFPLDTDCYAPSTPPLSTSGSAVSSPPSTAEILPTPVYSNFHGHGHCMDVKPGCEQEFSEMLAHDNWNAASPPMTPGMCKPFLYFFHKWK